MRYLVTPNFTNKVASQPVVIRQFMPSVLRMIEISDKTKLISDGLFGVPPQVFENDIFVFSSQSQDFSIYVTFGSDQYGEYILLMDFTLQQKPLFAKKITPYRNPLTNRAYNPKLNRLINPKLNRLINPKLNRLINPKLNRLINPKLNRLINPKLNRLINPKMNRLINPKLNRLINPKMNRLINPRLNSAYSGPSMYSDKLQQEGFMVRANDNVELIFDLNNEFTSICVKTAQNVFVLFDTNNEWIGFLVTANNEVRLKFNTDNEWTGIAV